MTLIDPKAAFFHVINDHWCLAAAGCAWNLVGRNASGATKNKSHKLIPNIDVLALDSLLTHARSLICFYESRGTRGTDILLSDFGRLAIKASLIRKMEKYRNPIEVHLLHLTDLRDVIYRGSIQSKRPKWNIAAAKIVRLILEAAKYVSKQNGDWPLAFKELYATTASRYENTSFNKPLHFRTQTKVNKFLTNLGL